MRYFKDLPLQTSFSLGGNVYVKVSTRTAVRLGETKSYYFRNFEVCRNCLLPTS